MDFCCVKHTQKIMIVGIRVNGVENEVKKLSFQEEKRELLGVSSLILDKVMENERVNVMLMLMKCFKKLRYEDLEEIYSDGCLVLWNKMMEKDFKLDKKGVGAYLKKICWNLGMHYLRKVKDGVDSLDDMMDNGDYRFEGCSMRDMFDVLENGVEDREKKFEELDMIWEKLSGADKMILQSYYIEGCKMDEIAVKMGYKNGNSVKTMKRRVLKKIMKIREEEILLAS